MPTQRHLLNSIRQYFLAGRFDKATERCLEGLAESPDNPDLHYLLALCDEKSGKIDDALSRLERVVKQDSHHSEARFELGRLLATRGQGADARKLLNACLELQPNHAPARTIRARLDRAEGRRSEAISGLKTALRADGNHAPALIVLAELMLEEKNLEAAAQYAEHAVQVAPDDPFAQIVMARVFTNKGQFGSARKCLISAAEQDSQNPLVHRAIGNLLQRMGRHPAAVVAYQTALRLGLNEPQMLRSLALSLAETGRLQDAARIFETLAPSSEDREVVVGLADLHAEAGDAAALQSLIERSSELPDEVKRWLEALSREVSGQLDQSLGLAMELLEVDDLDLKARVRLLAARLNLRLEHFDAVRDLLEPLAEHPRLTHAVHWELARLLRESGHHELAALSLEHVASREKLDDEARTKTQAMRVDVLDKAGHYDQAAELFEQAAWQAPYLGDAAYRKLAETGPGLDLSVLDGYHWPEVDEQAAQAFPVFIGAWPCTGRDLILAALARSGQFRTLSIADWPQRKLHLGLPTDLRNFDAIDSSQLHLMRRRYLRTRPRDGRMLEPAALQPLDLAQLARLFPGAVVIQPLADENYLKLQWRLVGYRQVPSMLETWRRDQALLERLRPHLPLKVIDCRLEALLSDPETTLDNLSQNLGLSFDESMRQAVEQAIPMRGYRPAQHWKHYFSPDRADSMP